MPDLTSLTAFIAEYGYLAIFLAMLLEGMCIPVPSELVMGFAGFLAYQQHLNLPGAIVAGWLGSLSGSFAIYLLARSSGRLLLYRWGHLISFGPERLDKLCAWFCRCGPPLIIPWRQLPIIRTKISIAAGLLDLHHFTFGLYTALGIAIWCTLSASLGFYLGKNWQLLLAIFANIGHYIIIVIFGLALFLVALFIYTRSRKINNEE